MIKHVPFSNRWTITEENLVRIKDSTTNESLKSREISTSFGVKYFFLLFPNGHTAEYRGKVTIFIRTDIGNLRKVGVRYTVRIESANNYSKTREHLYTKSSVWGEYFCDNDELFNPERKFIVDGKMVLTVDGFFEYDDGNVFSRGRDLTMGMQLWAKNDSKDFLIIASDGKGIKAHKFILQARSPVFAAMFRSNMKEAKENQVEIKDFSSDVIERALKPIYDYSGNFDASFEQMLSILQFLDKYDFQYLKDRFEGLLMDYINVMSACKLMNCAIKSNALKMKEKCFQFLTTAFEEKSPVADLDILEKEVLLKIVQNSLYQNVETDK